MGLNFFGPAGLFPLLMTEFNLSRGTVSLLMVSALVAITIGLIPSGMLVARIGPRRAIVAAGVFISLGLLSGALHNFYVILALRLAFGVGVSLLLPATSALLVQWYSAKDLPTMNGLTLAAQGFGTAVAMFVAVPLANAVGWEGVFLTFGTFAVGATVVWFIGGRNGPLTAGASGPPPLAELVRILKNRNTILLSLAGVGPFAMFIGFSSWLPTYYNEVFGIPLQTATTINTIPPLMGVVMSIVGGILISKVGRRKPFMFVPAIILPIAAFGTFYFNNLPLIIGSIIVLGAVFQVFIPVVFTIAMELPGIDPSRVGLVTSAALTFGNVATSLSPYLVGTTTDLFGSYVPSLSVLALLPLTVVAVAMLLPETGPKAPKSLGPS